MKGADWRHPYGPKSNINALDDHPVVHVSYSDALPMPHGPARSCRPKPSGNLPRAAGSTAKSSPGATTLTPGGKHMANTWQGEFPAPELMRGRI